MDPNDNVVEVEAKDLFAGSQNTTFSFSEELDEVAEGIWTVNGVEFDYAAFVAVKDVNDAVSDADELLLNDALESSYFANYNADNITAYMTDLTADAPFNVEKPLDGVEAIQTIVDEVNANQAAAEYVEDIVTADSKLALRTALRAADEANAIERYNEDYIDEYDTERLSLQSTGGDWETSPEDSETITDVQTKLIDAVNDAQAVDAIKTALADVDQELVDTALTTLDWVEEEKSLDTTDLSVGPAGDTNTAQTRETWVNVLEEHEAIISIADAVEAEDAAALDSALVELDTKQVDNTDAWEATFDYETVRSELMDDYLVAATGESITNYVGAEAIQTVITNENDFFDTEVVAYRVNASEDFFFTGSNLVFEVELINMYGDVIADGTPHIDSDPVADLDATVTMDDADDTQVADITGNTLSEGVFTVDSTISALDAGSYTATVAFDAVDGSTTPVVLDGNNEFTTDVVVENGPATLTNSTVQLDYDAATPYKSGDTISVELNLLDASEEVVTAHDGTYNATIMIADDIDTPGDDADTFNKSLTIENGVLTTTVTAKHAFETAELAIRIPALDSADQMNDTVVFTNLLDSEGTDIGTNEFEIDNADAVELYADFDTVNTTDLTAMTTLAFSDGYNADVAYDGAYLVDVTIYDDQDAVVAKQAVSGEVIGQPDGDGTANIDFAEGLFVNELDFSDMVNTLAEGYTIQFESEGFSTEVEITEDMIVQ